jgi:hypothetical protein
VQNCEVFINPKRSANGWNPAATGWNQVVTVLTTICIFPQVYETLTGVIVEGKLPVLKKEVVLQSLPSEWPLDPIDDIQRLNQNNSKTLVVLDDDPTGTQTVHDIEVLTEWWVSLIVLYVFIVDKIKIWSRCYQILSNPFCNLIYHYKTMLLHFRHIISANHIIPHVIETLYIVLSVIQNNLPKEEFQAIIICTFFVAGLLSHLLPSSEKILNAFSFWLTPGHWALKR